MFNAIVSAQLQVPWSMLASALVTAQPSGEFLSQEHEQMMRFSRYLRMMTLALNIVFLSQKIYKCKCDKNNPVRVQSSSKVGADKAK